MEKPDVCPHLGVRKIRRIQIGKLIRRGPEDRKERSESTNKESVSRRAA